MVVAKEKLRYDELTHAAPKPGKRQIRKQRTANLPRQVKILAVFLVVLIFVMGIGVAGLYAQLAIKNYKISQLDKDIASRKVQNDQLQLQVDKLSSVSRIESVATNQLGMVRPENYAFVDYQAAAKAQASMEGNTEQSAATQKNVAQSQSRSAGQISAGNPVIEQVAQILANLIGTPQR